MDVTQALTEVKGIMTNFKTAYDKRLNDMQTQMSAMNGGQRFGPLASKQLTEILRADEQVARLLKDRRGRAVIELKGQDAKNVLENKTTLLISTTGTESAGVVPLERIAGITPEARQVLRVRDVLYARPTSFQLVDFVRVSTPLSIASPVVEGATKPENALGLTAYSERVKVLATTLPASRQILDDFTELSGFLNSSLGYYVNLEEELQLLAGTGAGEDLNGLITQASAFQTGLLSASLGWNKIDIVGRAIQQITAAKEIQPTFVILHPNDWWEMRLTKDGFGRYILGDPQTDVPPSLFNKAVVATTSIAAGTFLIGSGDPVASEIRDREELQIEIATEHASFFTANLVMIRAEKRLALVVKRPASYVSGSFTTSPH